MRKRPRIRVPGRGFAAHWLERIRGRGEIMIDPPHLPLTVASYVRGRLNHALELQTALRETFPRLPGRLRALYDPVLAKAPSLVAVILRSRNVGDCLGHAHIVPTAFARRLARQTGRDVAGMDLAVDNIREWEPRPLARMAAESSLDVDERERVTRFREQLALLSVYLHELDHLANPGAPEREIRGRSDALYFEALDADVVGEPSAIHRRAA